MAGWLSVGTIAKCRHVTKAKVSMVDEMLYTSLYPASSILFASGA
jgi:hypothetical protein